MILGQETITLRRYATAYTWGDDGRATAEDPEETDILASVQPLRDREIQILPEGERQFEQKKIYTKTELRTEDQNAGTKADLLIINEIEYKVMQVERERSVLPHYKARVMRLQEEA